MKIAFFHNLPSGGALKCLAQSARLLASRGHPGCVYSFSTADHEFAAPLLDGVDHKVHPLEFKGPSKFRNYREASRGLAETINASEADVCVVHKCRHVGSPSILQWLKKPALFYSQEPLRYAEYERLAEAVSKETLKGSSQDFWRVLPKIPRLYDHWTIRKEDQKSMSCADCVMTNSGFTRDWLGRVYGVKAEVLYQGIDTTFFMPEPDKRRANRVLSVGRFDASKGYDFLLDVMAAIPPAQRPVWVIVCDAIDSSFKKKFDHRCQRKQINYQLHFRISEESLRSLYQSSRLVLCAAHHEPFGLVPLEAMACATPVLAVKEGGYRETIRDKETGYLLQRDSEAWGHQISNLLQTPDRLEAFGRKGRAHVEKSWTWRPFIHRMEQIFYETQHHHRSFQHV